MTSQAKPAIQGHPTVGASTSAKPIVPGDEPFKNVTRDNGVTFRATDTVSIQSYIDSFTDVHPAEDIISASRISNGRIAIYLSSRETVMDAVQRGLDHDGSFLELTPLIRPTTRITLSNVYPEIPNSVLVNNLSSFCKVVSQIRPIPLGFKNKKLCHIMSFRRHVQVLINDNITPPDHINFSYNGVNYRVFISTESVRCFSCGEFGHISRTCKKTPSDHDTRPDNPLNPPPVFVHGKSDPKHPPKKSKSSSSPITGGGSAASAGGGSGARPGPSDSAGSGASSAGVVASAGAGGGAPASAPASVGADGGASRSASVEPPVGVSAATSLGSVAGADSSPPASAGGVGSDSAAPGGSSSGASAGAASRGNSVYIWGTPPAPSRLFSEVTKRKKSPPSKPVDDTPRLIPLKSPSPARKIARKVSTPMQVTSPTVSQALDADPSTPTPSMPVPTHSTPASAADCTDTDSTQWEDSQTDDNIFGSAGLPTCKGPLKPEELLSFLNNVKSSKRPEHIARKFTQNIPGLVNQLKPLKNSPLLKKSLQQRIYKLIRKLDV